MSANPSAINSDCCMTVIPANLFQRLGYRLFPQRRIEWPEPPEGETAKDGLHHEITIELSFIDRLRVLFSGRAMVRSRILTENVIGRFITVDSFSSLPPKFMDR